MKTVWLIFIFALSGVSYSQEGYETPIFEPNIYEGVLSNLFVNHQPSARAEAMGRGLVANNNGDFGGYYNPALTSLSKGFNFNYSYSQSDKEKPSLNYYCLSYSDENIGSIGIIAYYFSKPQSGFNHTDLSEKGNYDAIYTVNYSREIIKDYFAGVNLGVYHYSNHYYTWFGNERLILQDGVTLDLGLLKKFEIETEDNKQTFQIGTSIYNIANSKVTFYDYYKNSLPVTFRIGASHKLNIENGNHIGVPYPLEIFTNIEYEKIVNSEFHATFRMGEELSLWKILHLRAGYFYSTVHDGYREDESEFTCGAGLSIPLSKLLKMKNKLDLKIDYVRTDIDKHDRYFFYDYGSPFGTSYYLDDYGTFYNWG